MTVKVYQAPTLVDLLMICNELNADEVEQYEALTGSPYDPQRVAAQFAIADGPAWVIVDVTHKPIAAGGFTMIRQGVWQDWMLTTPAAWDARNWFSLTRACRRAMDAMLQGGAHRLQCVSLASRTQAHRWYTVLGLELEGTLRGYGAHGEDAMMFARQRSPDG